MTDTTEAPAQTDDTAEPAKEALHNVLDDLARQIATAMRHAHEGNYGGVRENLRRVKETCSQGQQASYKAETPTIDLEAIMLQAVTDAIAARYRHTGIRYKTAVWRDVNHALPHGDSRYRGGEAWDALDRLIKQGKVHRTDGGWYGLGPNPKGAK